MSMKDLLNKMTELTGTQASTEVVSTSKKVLTENTGATDYEGKKGVNRTEALKKYANSKDPKDAEAARKAGATQTELKQAKDEVKESKPSLKGIFNEMLSEAEQITIQPANQNTQVIKQGQKTLGTVENPQLAQQIKQSIGKGEMTLAGDDELNETDDDISSPSLGTVKAVVAKDGLTVHVSVYKKNTLRGDSYWVHKQLKTFKKPQQAQEYAKRVNDSQKISEINTGNTVAENKLNEKAVDTINNLKTGKLNVSLAKGQSNQIMNEIDSDNVTETIVGKPHFVSLVKKYNQAVNREHKKYISRGLSKKDDWYDNQRKLMNDIKQIEKEIYKYYGNLTDESGNKLKEVGISSYDTSSPSHFVNLWLSSAKLNEKAVSKSQQQATGAALAAKRGDAPKSKLKGASKEMAKMSTKELEKFAKTKHKGLPDKKEKMDEHNQVLDKSKYFDKSVKPKVGDVVIVVRAMPFWSSWYHRGDEFTVAGIKDDWLKVKKHDPENRFNNHGVTLKHPVAADHVRVMKPTTEAAMPTHDGDFGAGLGAGRNSKTLESKKAKPDYIDLDKDGNKKEKMKKAAAEQKVSTMKKTNEDKGTPIMLSPVGKDKKDNKSTPALCTKHNKPLYKKDEGENAWRGCEDCPPKKTNEAKSKPDYIDLDKDDNKKESMKKAAADKKKKSVKEEDDNKTKTRTFKYEMLMANGRTKRFTAANDAEAKRIGKEANAKSVVKMKGLVPGNKIMESANPTEAARLLGKAHALGKDPFACKYEEGSPEAQAYLDGYKEGLDECYGSGGGMRAQQDIGMMPGMDSMVSMTDTQSPRGGSEFEIDSMDDVGGFGGFDDQPDEADVMAFEAWDRQLNELLNEGSDTETKKPVKEGISVSVSKGQQGAPDSVTVSAQDGDADALLATIKQAGLGLFGGEEQGGYGAPTTPQMPTSGASDIGDHDSMMALIKQMTTGSNDYEDEESQDDQHVHGHPDAACDACGSSDCGCDYESDSKAVVVGEEETEDQMEFEVAEDADSDEAETTADEDAEAEEDKALAGADSDNEEEIDEEKELNEWANDAGYTGSENTKDNTFEEDIDFMTRVISGGLNGPKKDQTTLPHTKVTVDDVSESILDWKKLSGIK